MCGEDKNLPHILEYRLFLLSECCNRSVIIQFVLLLRSGLVAYFFVIVDAIVHRAAYKKRKKQGYSINHNKEKDRVKSTYAGC